MRKSKRPKVTALVWKLQSGKPPANPYLEALSDFRNDLTILIDVNKNLPQSVQRLADQRRKEYQKTLKKVSPTTRGKIQAFAKTPGAKTRKLTGEAAEIVYKAFLAMLFENRSITFIRDMGLVYLITSFEDFLQDILQETFRQRPESMSTKSKTVTYEQLFKCKEFEDLLSELREEEIRSCLNQDVDKVDRYFSERFKIAISQCAADWKTLAERFYRRNILIHNSGIVNETYRKKTGYSGPDTRMGVTEDYLSKSIEIFEKTATSLTERFNAKFGKDLPKK